MLCVLAALRGSSGLGGGKGALVFKLRGGLPCVGVPLLLLGVYKPDLGG